MAVELTGILSGGTIGLIVADNISVAEDMQYQQADVPEAVGMVLNIAPNGLVGLTRIAAPAVTDISTDNRLIAVTSTTTEIVAVTTTAEHTAAESAFEFTCRIDNTVNQTRALIFRLKIDAVENGSTVVNMDKNEINHSVVFSGPLTATHPASTVISMDVDSVATGANIRGDLQASIIKVVKV